MRLLLALAVLAVPVAARAEGDHHFVGGLGVGVTSELGWLARFSQSLDVDHATASGEPLADGDDYTLWSVLVMLGGPATSSSPVSPGARS